MKLVVIFILTSLSFGLNAQVIDDFEDGDLKNNPVWSGDVSDFGKSASGELQLLSVKESSPASISTAAIWNDTCSWEIYIKADAKLSASVNYIKIYLSSNNENIEGSLNGYYLKIGENGDADKLLFYKQKGSSTTKLGEGVDATMGNPLGGNDLRLLVTRSNKGEWIFSTDTVGGKDFKEEFRVIDKELASGAFFGLSVNFSSANVNRFFFDDLRVAPIFSDNDAPTLEALNVVDDRNIELRFNETIDETTAELLSTYTIDGQQVVAAQLRSTDARIVEIESAFNFSDGSSYQLKVDGLEDLYGNVLSGFIRNFTYQKPQPADVRITEIFADPTPVIGLPEYEFVELFNAGTQTVDIGGWLFSDASKEVVLPSFELAAGTYVILCSETAQTDFASFGATLPIGLPALNNGEDQLTLKNSAGLVMDEAFYNLGWYDNPAKKDGGYSLELVNPTLMCSDEGNWKASLDPSGGTPGETNSVWGTKADKRPPEAITFTALYSDTVLLIFNEPLDSSSVVNASFDLKGIGKPSTISVSAFPHKEVTLGFDNPMKENEKHTIFVNGVQDCEGNNLDEEYWGKLLWLVPKKAYVYDVVINEIYADPDPALGLPPSEFVELYNRSENPISLENWTFSDSRDTVILPNFILDANAYVILCDQGDEGYWQEFGDVLGIEGFPGLNNAGELLGLVNPGGYVHYVDYSDDWYDSDAKQDGGYTLEMIDSENPCGQNGNWTGAKSNVFGTPGAINSQQDDNPDLVKPYVLRVLVSDSNQIDVFINEPLHLNSGIYSKLSDPDFGPRNWISTNIERDHSILAWNKNFEKNKIYYIDLKEAFDCAGNTMDEQTFELALPEKIDSFDVVINEVLFNPRTGGSDFVELYNRSDSYFDLRDLLIANRDDDGVLSSVYGITVPYLLKPGSFVALTTSREDVLSKYNVKSEADLLEVDQLPSFADGDGEVVVLDRDTQIVDELTYSDEWHYALLDDVNGYSLERINYNAKTQNSANWHSASSSSGGATPTYINSQNSDDPPTSNTIELSGESFSPDNDGFEDFLSIHILSETTDQSATIKIFNLDGQMVRDLVPHDVLGIRNLYQWDGLTEQGDKAAIGVYIILLEILNTQEGSSERFKKSVVLTGRI